MDIYRKMTVWDLLNFLKSRVKNNVDSINTGFAEIKAIQNMDGNVIQIQPEIDRLNDQVSKLTAENNQLLHLFNELLKAHNLYLSDFNTIDFSSIPEPAEKMTEEFINSCMEKTIAGEMPINLSNPILSDEKLAANLLQRCLNEEHYEKCAQIIQVRQKR